VQVNFYKSKILYAIIAILLVVGVGFFIYTGADAGLSKVVYESRPLQIPILELDKNVVKKFQEKVEGLTMFRGNPERNWYGQGPVPANPVVAWRYPDKPMCSLSEVYGETKQWCGNGWTGEPVVWDRPDGVTEVIFGAYDGKVHFVNAKTGKDTRASFQTGDIVKGSVTLDPDGFPFLYFGSRDNYLRVLDISTDLPKEVWKMSSLDDKGMWNNDWDSNPVVVDDILYEGCENGYFYAIKLNRSFGASGVATVSPILVFKHQLYNDDIIGKTDGMQSIESSTLIVNNRAYISNSAGHILGFDISNIESGVAPVTFDFWTGDDTDATLISDADGMIYASVELERFNARSRELGQLIKLDPTKADPFLWGIAVPGATEKAVGGIWATPAIYKNYLYVSTHKGELLAVETDKGQVVWQEEIGFHAWGSPSVVDETLVVPSCADGNIRSYDIATPESPKLLWSQKAGSGWTFTCSAPKSSLARSMAKFSA
jgi:outer membrane protein assembly factor BamB